MGSKSGSPAWHDAGKIGMLFGLVGVLDDRLPRLALLVLPGLRGRHFRFS
jgi:hypothetical protein